MNGFERRAQQIKEKIMTVTLDMLSTSDLRSLRIVDIAREAAVSQVTIYNYFGSKEGLVREVFRHEADEATRAFEAYMEEEHTLQEKFEHILFMKKRYFKHFPPRLIQELLAADPELAQYVAKQSAERSVPAMIRMLEEGKRNGDIADKVSIPAVLAFIRLLSDRMDVILEMAEQSGDTDRFLEETMHLFFYGICGKE